MNNAQLTSMQRIMSPHGLFSERKDVLSGLVVWAYKAVLRSLKHDLQMSRPVWATRRAQGQPGRFCETLSRNRGVKKGGV